MGFEEGRILFNGPSNTFYPGQVLSGRLEFELSKQKSFRGLYLEIKGFCKVHWTTSHTRRVNDRTEHYTVAHESYEEYMNITIYLAGAKSGEHTLQSGFHTFPFECQIPQHAPSSFSGSEGHVKYEVKAVVDRPFKFNQNKVAEFKVVSPLDLNTNPYCKEPIEIEFINSYCCWCMNAGNSETTVKVPRGGYCPGETAPIEVACLNTSSVELEIQIQLNKEVIYRAEHEPDTRYENSTVVELKKGPIGGGTTRNYTMDLLIPHTETYNLMNCKYIDVNYKLNVQIITSGCHEDQEESRPLIIGSIPLSDNTVMAESAQLNQGVNYYPPPPIVTQPYPTNSPYPAPQNPPYPANGANPPFQPSPILGNQPYPNQPFPGANPPYPNSPAPYPAGPTSSPYQPPGPVPAPYPPAGVPSPYPPAGVQSPYPPSGMPHQGQTPPYPNPGAPSPYPPASTGVGGSSIRTGNIGFVGDGATVPLLPVGAAVPPPYPTSPYASASAPEPSTPDQDGKAPPNNESTPFNPQFK